MFCPRIKHFVRLNQNGSIGKCGHMINGLGYKTLIDEGSVGALDLVYLMQDKIGQKNAVNAAIGIGGGAWKDYVNDSGELLMTLKLSGDDSTELQEIYDAFKASAFFDNLDTSSSPISPTATATVAIQSSHIPK